jgi:hypothetical protein
VKGSKKIYKANGLWKQVGVAILISVKVHFKLTLVKQDKEGHFILMKGAINEKEIKLSTYMHPISSKTC